jgi:hypothetical protein
MVEWYPIRQVEVPAIVHHAHQGDGMSKTLFKGSRRLIDADTGEVIETQVVERSVEGGDAGYHKIWLGHILELVDELGNAKMNVLVWLLKEANSQNQVDANLDEIAAGSGVGKSSVQRLMKALLAADVIARPRRYGPWRLNPDVIFQGGHQRRMNVLIKYRNESQADLFEPVEASAAKVIQLPRQRMRVGRAKQLEADQSA